MHKYSVLLEYPGGDTFFAWVTANDPEAAVVEAKAIRDATFDPEDMTVLIVLAGHCEAELRKDDF